MNYSIYFMICFTITYATGSSEQVVAKNDKAAVSSESNTVDSSLDTKKPIKRDAASETAVSHQYQNIQPGLSSAHQLQHTVTSANNNYQSIYPSNFSPIGQYFASAASPQIYYVKAPVQNNHHGGGGIQYAQNAGLKISYLGTQYQQQPVAYASQHNPKVAYATQQSTYPQYQLAYSNQALSYQPISVPYTHPQQIIPIANNAGYQVQAASTHVQQVPVAQAYSYLPAATPATAKVIASTATPVAAPAYYTSHANQAYSQPTFTYSAYQHIPQQYHVPTTQKLVAIPAYSSAAAAVAAHYKSLASQQQQHQVHPTPAASVADGATSYAAFSQHLNHATPTSLSPVKVLAQPQQYYATASPPSYSQQKIAFTPIAAAASVPQTYATATHTGAIHYGSHLYHPALAKYGYGPVAAPPQKLIYAH